MTKTEQSKKLEELKDEAKEYQLRFAYLALQLDNINKEIEDLKVLMRVQNAKYDRISQTQTADE